MNQINYYIIKLLHKRLRFSRKLSYTLPRLISAILSNKSHRKNAIFSPIYTTINKNIISTELGYGRFNSKDSHELGEIVKTCQLIFKENKSKYNEELFLNNPNKQFLLTVSSDEQLLENKVFNRFFQSDFIKNTIQSYFGHAFVLGAIRLWWTPVNKTSISSQMFHIDEEDETQIKLFINVSEVTNEHGPFTFLPITPSKRILSIYRNGKRRYTDDEVFQHVDPTQKVSLIGPAGSGAFVDTSKCLHFGSRNNSKDRLILMAQFLKTNAPLLDKSMSL